MIKPSVGGTCPFTRTAPDAIKPSAARRLATPDLARNALSRTGRGQMIERLQPQHLQEPHGGAVELRLPRTAAPADLGDEVAKLEVGQHALAVHAADLLDARARHRLVV